MQLVFDKKSESKLHTWKILTINSSALFFFWSLRTVDNATAVSSLKVVSRSSFAS